MLISGVGGVDGFGDCFEEGDKVVVGFVLFGEFIECLFCLNDLFFGFFSYVYFGCVSRD